MITLTDERRPRTPFVAPVPRKMVMDCGNVECVLGNMHACTHLFLSTLDSGGEVTSCFKPSCLDFLAMMNEL